MPVQNMYHVWADREGAEVIDRLTCITVQISACLGTFPHASR